MWDGWQMRHKSEARLGADSPQRTITLQDGKFSRIEITFDQMPLAQAFGDQASQH